MCGRSTSPREAKRSESHDAASQSNHNPTECQKSREMQLNAYVMLPRLREAWPTRCCQVSALHCHRQQLHSGHWSLVRSTSCLLAAATCPSPRCRRRHLLFLPMLLAPAIDTVQLKHCGGSLGSFYNSIAQIWQQEIIEESHHEVDIQPRRLCCPVFVRWRTSLVSF